MIWGLVVLLLCIIASVLLGLRLYKDRIQQRELVARMRKSEIYGHLYPQLLRCNEQIPETVSIRPNGLALRFLLPIGDTLRCSFDAMGFDDMEQVPLYALAQAVAVDVPILCDKRAYRLVVHQEKRIDGITWNWYEYAIQTRYKDEMMRTILVKETGTDLF